MNAVPKAEIRAESTAESGRRAVPPVLARDEKGMTGVKSQVADVVPGDAPRDPAIRWG